MNYFTHIKPGKLNAVLGEITALDRRHAAAALVAGQVIATG